MKSVSGIVFLVNDLQKSVTFYEKLGFLFKKSIPGVSAYAYLNWFWIELLLEDKVVSEAFLDDASIKTKEAGSYTHISVDDVDAYYSYLQKQGIKAISMPEDFPWGRREFVVADPDGYKLVFFTKN